MTKNPHAVALGRRGAKARGLSPADLSRIGKLGGRPRRYRVEADRVFRHYTGIGWIPLAPPYDKAARAFLYRAKTAAARA